MSAEPHGSGQYLSSHRIMKLSNCWLSWKKTSMQPAALLLLRSSSDGMALSSSYRRHQTSLPQEAMATFSCAILHTMATEIVHRPESCRGGNDG